MQFRVETLGSITFLGVREMVRHESGFFEALWQGRFNRRSGEILDLSLDCHYYGVTFADGDSVFYLAGMAVPPSTVAPEGLVTMTVPSATYVVVPTRMTEIGATYEWIYKTLIPERGWTDDLTAADFEKYPPKGSKDEGLEIYVSVIR